MRPLRHGIYFGARTDVRYAVALMTIMLTEVNTVTNQQICKPHFYE